MFAAAMRRTWNDPLLRFLLSAALLYGAWYMLYEWVLHPWGALDRMVIDNLMALSGGMLTLAGYTLIPETHVGLDRYQGVQGGSQLWIGDPCDGIPLFAVFMIFMIIYPGPLRHKLWFLPIGLATIHLINALRIAVLCIIVTIDYELLNFNHDYTFYLVVYGWVFGLWYWWVQRFSGHHPKMRTT